MEIAQDMAGKIVHGDPTQTGTSEALLSCPQLQYLQLHWSQSEKCNKRVFRCVPNLLEDFIKTLAYDRK